MGTVQVWSFENRIEDDNFKRKKKRTKAITTVVITI